MVVLLACFSLIVYAVIRRALISEFDSSLVSTATMVAAFVEIEGDRIVVDSEVEEMVAFRDSDHPTYYQIWDLDGQVIAKSRLLDSRDLPCVHGALGVRVRRAPRDPRDDRPLRAVGLRFTPQAEEDQEGSSPETPEQRALVMAVARDATRLYGQLAFLGWLLLAAGSATAGLALLVAVCVVRRGLRPLEVLAAEIAVISEEDLGTRVGGTDIPVEIAPMRDRLNGLLSRLERAFDRERRLTADVAHELRTPLAGIRTTMDVALARQRDTAEYRAALSECRDIILGLQTLVGNLLALARLEACRSATSVEHVALAELVDSTWRQFSARAASRDLVFENRIADDLMMDQNSPQLSIILSNLLSNAVDYADVGGRIWSAAREVDEAVELTVSNTGCALTSEESAHVFDRFWRANTSRSEIGVHSGLGLTLVREMAKALRGSASVEVRDGTFTARIVLPAAADSSESSDQAE